MDNTKVKTLAMLRQAFISRVIWHAPIQLYTCFYQQTHNSNRTDFELLTQFFSHNRTLHIQTYISLKKYFAPTYIKGRLQILWMNGLAGVQNSIL